MGKIRKKGNPRHCGEKTSYFFATVLIRKKILSHLYLLNGRQNQPRRNKFICRRNTYPRSASQEEEKEKTPFLTSLPLDP